MRAGGTSKGELEHIRYFCGNTEIASDLEERETPREHVERENHYVWGKRYLLAISEGNEPPSIDLTPRRMLLRVRRGTSQDSRKAIVEDWYRGQLKEP